MLLFMVYCSWVNEWFDNIIAGLVDLDEVGVFFQLVCFFLWLVVCTSGRLVGWLVGLLCVFVWCC